LILLDQRLTSGSDTRRAAVLDEQYFHLLIVQVAVNQTKRFDEQGRFGGRFGLNDRVPIPAFAEANVGVPSASATVA